MVESLFQSGLRWWGALKRSGRSPNASGTPSPKRDLLEIVEKYEQLATRTDARAEARSGIHGTDIIYAAPAPREGQPRRRQRIVNLTLSGMGLRKFGSYQGVSGATFDQPCPRSEIAEAIVAAG